MLRYNGKVCAGGRNNCFIDWKGGYMLVPSRVKIGNFIKVMERSCRYLARGRFVIVILRSVTWTITPHRIMGRKGRSGEYRTSHLLRLFSSMWMELWLIHREKFLKVMLTLYDIWHSPFPYILPLLCRWSRRRKKAGKGSFLFLFRGGVFCRWRFIILFRPDQVFAGESISGGIWRICKSHYS